MIGLVFVGTYYYLESGFRTFQFFRADLERLMVGHAKVIITLFSFVLGLSLLQEPFFQGVPTIVTYSGITILAFCFTRSLSHTYKEFSKLFKEKAFMVSRALSWLWFLLAFIVPLFFTLLNENTFRLQKGFLDRRTIAWGTIIALALGYVNLVQFLLTPYQWNRREREESDRQNRLARAQGKEPERETWSKEKRNYAEERINQALEKAGYSALNISLIQETYKAYSEISADLQLPHLRWNPQVSEYGEAQVHAWVPDVWNTDRELGRLVFRVASEIGQITFKSYRDLTKVDVRIWRSQLVPWKEHADVELLLLVQWEGAQLPHLDVVSLSPEDVIRGSTHLVIGEPLFPLGFEEYEIDPDEYEVKESEDYRVFCIEDKSHARAKRYSAKIIIKKGQPREMVRKIAKKAIQEIRKELVYRNEKTRERFGRKAADIVWLQIYDEAKNRDEMLPLDGYSHFICQVQWISPNLEKEFWPLPLNGDVEKHDGITIRWAR